MGKGRDAQGLLNFLVWWGYLVTSLCFIPYRWNSYFQKHITSLCLFGEACWAWFNLFLLRWEFWKGFGFIFQTAGANCRKTESVEIQNIGYLPGIFLIFWKWIVLFYHSSQNADWRLFSSSLSKNVWTRSGPMWVFILKSSEKCIENTSKTLILKI